MSPDLLGGGADPTVSVLLPTYNRARLLGRAIQSVLDQSYTEFELIVVDDGSTDDTAAVVRSFRDGRIRYLPLSYNTGAGAARNAGIRIARGKFLAFQDSDDEWVPSKLASQMAVFERGPKGLGMVYSDMQKILIDGTTTYVTAPNGPFDHLVNPGNRFYQLCNLGVQSAVIKREYLHAAGYFDESLRAFEDMEMFIRLSKQCVSYRLAEPLVKYYVTQGRSRDAYAAWTSRKLILRSYCRELLSQSPAFVFREMLWLCRHRRYAVRTRREAFVSREVGHPTTLPAIDGAGTA